MNINVGDTAVIRGTVTDVFGSLVTVKTPGNRAPLCIHVERITEVIPKPRLPRVGEIWEVKDSAQPTKRKVYFADDSYVVYEVISNGGGIYKKTITYFLDHFRPET